MTLEERKENFIKKAREIHGVKYDYSKVEYINNSTKVCIICPKHGEFWQSPANHIHKSYPHGCPFCRKNAKLTKESFIKKARELHGDKYDYSKVNFDSQYKKICIICPKHGEFWQSPANHNHVSHPRGCPICNGGVRQSLEEFIEKAREIHGDKYDYSKVVYKNANKKICIICPEHGEFWQTPHSHLRSGCPKCRPNFKLDTKSFIEQARKVHGDKYDYSKVEYVNTSTKICIVCPKHGEFWQTPNSHLSNHGCPKCHSSNLEKIIKMFLKSKNIKFIEQKRFKWLKKDSSKFQGFSLDFFLPDFNAAIECQGKQHFEEIEQFVKNGEIYSTLDYVQNNDRIKKELCEQHGIKMFYFSNLGISYPYEVYEDETQMLNEIFQYHESQKTNL